jgi:hypothetical protein
MHIFWGGLWCLTPLSTIFQLYCGSQFYWWRKPPTYNVVWKFTQSISIFPPLKPTREMEWTWYENKIQKHVTFDLEPELKVHWLCIWTKIGQTQGTVWTKSDNLCKISECPAVFLNKFNKYKSSYNILNSKESADFLICEYIKPIWYTECLLK